MSYITRIKLKYVGDFTKAINKHTVSFTGFSLNVVSIMETNPPPPGLSAC